MKALGTRHHSPFGSDGCRTLGSFLGLVCPQDWESSQGETVLNCFNFAGVPELEKALRRELGGNLSVLPNQRTVPRTSA